MAANMTIEELHDKLFEVLCIIDDICKKENVRYFLDSGTEIGAIREKNFIPWDDDMDIKVLAEDYPAFKSAMEKNLPKHMHIVEPDIFAPGWYDFTVRIYDERDLIRVENDEDNYYNNYNNHVGTDVFIFNQINNTCLQKKWMLFASKVLYGLGMAHRYTLHQENYTILQKTQVKILNCFGKLLSSRKICKIWKNMILKPRKCKKPCRFSSNYSIPSLQFFPEQLYEKTVYFPIRGRMFPVPGGYDEELSQQYGDYMKPPKNRDAYQKHLQR